MTASPTSPDFPIRHHDQFADTSGEPRRLRVPLRERRPRPCRAHPRSNRPRTPARAPLTPGSMIRSTSMPGGPLIQGDSLVSVGTPEFVLRDWSAMEVAAPLNPEIAVVVPTYQRPDSLNQCLEGLAAQTLPPSLVYVVVRDTDVMTRPVIDFWSSAIPLQSLTCYRPGVVAAMTVAANNLKSPLVALIDDDAVPPPDWLECLSALMLSSGAEIVCGRDIISARREQSSELLVGELRWYGKLVGNHHIGTGPVRQVDLFKGVNVLFRTSYFLLPPPGLLRGSGAEVSWEIVSSRRALLRGATILYDPAITVQHNPALRWDEDSRENPTARALGNQAHNTFIATTLYNSVWRVLAVLSYRLLIGMRSEPGLVRASIAAARGERAIVRRFAPSLWGTLLGLSTWWRLGRFLAA